MYYKRCNKRMAILRFNNQVPRDANFYDMVQRVREASLAREFERHQRTMTLLFERVRNELMGNLKIVKEAFAMCTVEDRTLPDNETLDAKLKAAERAIYSAHEERITAEEIRFRAALARIERDYRQRMGL